MHHYYKAFSLQEEIKNPKISTLFSPNIKKSNKL